MPALGGALAIQNGRFNLFRVEAEVGLRQMTYAFRFTGGDQQTHFLYGHKDIEDDPGKIDVVEDMTRLFVTLHRGEDRTTPVCGAGELYFKLRDLPTLVSSMKVLGAASWRQRVAALVAFSSFAHGALRNEYLKEYRLFYETQYENLVLAGSLGTGGGAEAPFFFVSGVHDKGFPWGDGEIFWDVLLGWAMEAGAGSAMPSPIAYWRV